MDSTRLIFLMVATSIIMLMFTSVDAYGHHGTCRRRLACRLISDHWTQAITDRVISRTLRTDSTEERFLTHASS